MTGTIVGFTAQYIAEWKQSEALADVRGTILETMDNGNVLVRWQDGFCTRSERVTDLVFFS